ncbi:MAG: hypothetical protein R6W90_10550 [Ignavibacteriaceae bacterium]
MKRKILFYITLFVFVLPMLILFSSCESEDNNPAGPGWNTPLKEINIEENTYKPRLSWVGGYVSVIGVNRGSRASLDSSLVWLIKADGNNLKYSTRFGTIPNGASDLTTQFGGTKIDSLSEDEVYTFWLLKEDVWSQVSAQLNSKLLVDSSLSSSLVVEGDSVRINPFSYSNLTRPVDVFINIKDVSTFGRLGVISITETASNLPVISWTVNPESSDPNISVIGISEGGQHSLDAVIWEIYSVRDSSAGEEVIKVYGKDNIISSPLFAGDSVPNTMAFVPLTTAGLERNKTYYVWIANKDWDGVERARFAAGYAYATFNVR